MFELSHVLGTRKLALAAIVAVIGTASQAAPIISSGQNLEVQKRSSGFPPSPEYSVSQAQPATGFRAGYQSSFYPVSESNMGGIEAVYMFKLPELPAGEQVGAATFSVSVLKPSVAAPTTPVFNVDLYALGYDLRDPSPNDNPPYDSGGVDSTGGIAQSYFFAGPEQAPTTISPLIRPVTKLADNLFTPADHDLAKTALNIPRTTSALPGAALAQYIQSIYEDPNYAPGGYLLLRLTPDAAAGAVTSGTQRYQFSFAPETGPSGTSYP